MATANEVMRGGFAAGAAVALGGQGVSIAAAGSSQTDATAMVSSIAIVTAADGTKGVILPAGAIGDELWVFNSSASTLKVYPPVGAAVSVAGTGLGTVNAAFSQLTQKCTLYKCQSVTQWFAITSA